MGPSGAEHRDEEIKRVLLLVQSPGPGLRVPRDHQLPLDSSIAVLFSVRLVQKSKPSIQPGDQAKNQHRESGLSELTEKRDLHTLGCIK